MPMPRHLRDLLALVLSVALPALACGRSDEAEQSVSATPELPPGTPVIVYSIDTLRSDRLPVYGYGEVETPAIDRFAEESILFEHAYTHVPMTLPAHVSLFSGLLPNQHGVRANLGYRHDARSHPWLPTLLSENGYRTGAGVSALVLREATGMAAGFDLYEDAITQRDWGALGAAQRDGHETLARTDRWLAARAEDRSPFFLFFHIYEPHTPFDPPAPFSERYGESYDGEVAAADDITAAFFDRLRKLGLYDRALIFLLSDHGEGLGDHGYLEHGPLLYREVLQVPLMIRLPGGERGGTRISEPAQLIDVLPTVAELLDLDVGAELPGRSMLAELPADRPVYTETYYPRIHFGWSELTGIIEYPYHLVWGPDPELYDLVEDPAETRNILADERRLYARLRDDLETYEQNYAAPGEVSAEERAQLAALGYAGSVVRDEGTGADPKQKIHVLRDLTDAYRLFEAGEHEAAIEAYREILAEEPRLADAWEYLGHALLEIGRPRAALDAYEETIELTGGDHVLLAAADALSRLGRLDEARRHAEAALDSFPGEGNHFLARLALREERLDDAATHLERALSASPSHPTYLLTRARLLLHRGELHEAIELTREIEGGLQEGVDPHLVEGLYLVRGQAHARLGDGEEAERAFRREIELSPGELAPYSHLALLHALQGEAAAAGRVLKEMVEKNPRPEAYAEAAHTLTVLGDRRRARQVLAEGKRRWPEVDWSGVLEDA